MKTFVVADTHGKPELLLKLLQVSGFVDHTGSRRINTTDKLVHIGDLANCVDESQSGDIRCLQMGRDFFDILIVGNHEYPYFAGTSFGGFQFYHGVEVAITTCDNLWLPSYCVGNTLLTHAGLTNRANTYDASATADEIHLDLVAKWMRDPTYDIFRACGPERYGPDLYSGILWADMDESKVRTISQVFGHTPQRTGRIVESHAAENNTFWANIDAGAKWDQANLTGVWLNEEGYISGMPINVSVED